MLGPATKRRFEQMIDDKVLWNNFDVRKKVTKQDVTYFNSFDCVVLGGGGLLLPDTNPNNISCWQWACPAELYGQVTAKMYVISIGWNHFYGQDITMSDRDSDTSVPNRKEIFKKNIEALIDNSEHFSLRHNGDCEELRKIVDDQFHEKITFSPCPVIDYVKSRHEDNFENNKVFHTFEIKDDRPNRRYQSTTRSKVYTELLSYINGLIAEGERIAVMSHDGSMSFASFLHHHGVQFAMLNNSIANEEKIIHNYSKVKKLYCTAGHSQMTAYALGLDFHSLISHDKLEYFLKDIDRFKESEYTYVKDPAIAEKLKTVLKIK